MDSISFEDVRAAQRETDQPYFEFLREASMSIGRYVLPAGGRDPQSPHTEDEAYYVVGGRATIRIADDAYPVEPGDVVYVEREVDHRFVEIEEPLELLVFFAPAEGTLDGEG